MVKKLSLSYKDLEDCRKPLKHKDASYNEVEVNRVAEYLDPEERIQLFNEVHRILKKGGKLVLTVPHWASSVAWGDLRFKYPPVAESWFFHTNKKWREENGGDDRLTCDFSFTCGYGMHPSLVTRNQEYQMNALQFYKEAAQSIIATFTKN